MTGPPLVSAGRIARIPGGRPRRTSSLGGEKGADLFPAHYNLPRGDLRPIGGPGAMTSRDRDSSLSVSSVSSNSIHPKLDPRARSDRRRRTAPRGRLTAALAVAAAAASSTSLAGAQQLAWAKQAGGAGADTGQDV